MQLFQNNSFRKAYKCQNNLDPDQDQYFVGPDLGPNFLQRLSADDKSPLFTSSDQESNTMYTDQTAPGLKLRVHTKTLILLFLNQNICWGYSKEPSQ